MSSRWPRRLGITAGGLVTVLAVLVATVWGLTEYRFRKTWNVQPRSVAVSSDSATLSRGRHIVTAIAKCAECHGSDLGGQTLIDNGAMGRLASSNLTPGRGGIGTGYTTADWVRAIRHGVDKQGKAMLIMPSFEYSQLSDVDLGAVVSYLQTLPPVDRERPARKINLLPRALLTFGMFPQMGAEAIAHDSVRGDAPPAGVTKEYGRYLATVGGCTGCHNPNLSGGPSGEPGAPPAANITPGGIGRWTEADFFRALRDGKRPDGSAIRDAMPWQASGKMTDDEIRAVWAFLRSVPAREFGK